MTKNQAKINSRTKKGVERKCIVVRQLERNLPSSLSRSSATRRRRSFVRHSHPPLPYTPLPVVHARNNNWERIVSPARPREASTWKKRGEAFHLTFPYLLFSSPTTPLIRSLFTRLTPCCPSSSSFLPPLFPSLHCPFPFPRSSQRTRIVA